MNPEPTRPVTLRQLLRLEDLDGYELASETGDLDGEVRDVVVAPGGARTSISRNALVIAAYRRTAGYEAELLLRKADTSGAVGVLLTGAGQVMRSTRRLAERIGMPLLALPAGDPVDTAWRLSRHIHDPEQFAARLLTGVLHRLRTPVTRLNELIDIVTTELGATAAVLTADGAVFAGQPVEDLPIAPLEQPVLQHVDDEGGHMLYAPAFVEDSRRPELWLIARLPPSHSAWVATSLQALSAVSLALAGWTARQRLAVERDARDRSTLLSELVDAAHGLPRHVAERAVQAGWRLDGWHVGIHIRADGDPAAIVRLTARVRKALNDAGLDGSVVERSDGWACWITENREPPSSSHRNVTDQVRHAIDDIAEDVNAVAGIGKPYAGPEGIATTLQEAREACLFAGTGRRRGRVEHVDELGVRRVLADWYHADAFRSYARTLLAPLLDSGEGQLLDTLRTYLELESSASSAAAALHVHRNTVAYRIARVEQILSMSLARPDERLVLQLACRVLQGGEGTSG